MKNKIAFVIFLIAVVMSAAAVDINFSEEKLVENSTQQEDYLFGGEALEFNGTADNLYFFGNDLVFTGVSESGITAVGQRIVLKGTINNDSHIVAKTVEVQSQTKGTIFIAAEDIILGEGSSFQGDLLTAAQLLTIDGVIDGDVYAASGKVIINSTIKGNLFAKTGKILFGENGRVEGNVEYSSDWQLSDADRQKIGGSVEFTEWDKDNIFRDTEAKEFKDAMTFFGIIFSIIIFLSFLIAGLLLLLFPATKTLEEERTNKRFFYSVLWGLIPFFVFPVIVILGIILGITAPMALVLMLAGIPLLVFTQIIGITLVGQFLFKLFKWKKKSRHLFFLFGMAAAIIISIIPFASGLGFIFFSALGWGKILEGLFKTEFGNGKPKTAEPAAV